MNHERQLAPMRIHESAFNEIINYIGSRPAESGGMLFGREDDYVITRFVPDSTASTTRATYTINAEAINPIIQKLWKEEQLSLIGIVHSHPRGFGMLSAPDMAYFSDLLRNMMKREHFYTPLVFTVPDGGFQMIAHVVNADGEHIGRTNVELVHENAAATRSPIPFTPGRRSDRKLLPIASAMLGAMPMRRVLRWQLALLAMLVMALLGWYLVAIWPHLIHNTIQHLR